MSRPCVRPSPYEDMSANPLHRADSQTGLKAGEKRHKKGNLGKIRLPILIFPGQSGSVRSMLLSMAKPKAGSSFEPASRKGRQWYAARPERAARVRLYAQYARVGRPIPYVHAAIRMASPSE